MNLPKLPTGDGPVVVGTLAFTLFWHLIGAEVPTLALALVFLLLWRLLGRVNARP